MHAVFYVDSQQIISGQPTGASATSTLAVSNTWPGLPLGYHVLNMRANLESTIDDSQLFLLLTMMRHAVACDAGDGACADTVDLSPLLPQTGRGVYVRAWNASADGAKPNRSFPNFPGVSPQETSLSGTSRLTPRQLELQKFSMAPLDIRTFRLDLA